MVYVGHCGSETVTSSWSIPGTHGPRYGAVEPTAVRLPIEALEDPPSFEVATVELFGPFQAEKMVEIDGHLPFKHQAIGDLTNEQMNKWFGCKEDNQPQKNAV